MCQWSGRIDCSCVERPSAVNDRIVFDIGSYDGELLVATQRVCRYANIKAWKCFFWPSVESARPWLKIAGGPKLARFATRISGCIRTK